MGILAREMWITNARYQVTLDFASRGRYYFKCYSEIYNKTKGTSPWAAGLGLMTSNGNKTSVTSTETKMSSFWRNFNHWLHWKLSFWQLPVQPVMKISSKWRHFRFSVPHWFLFLYSQVNTFVQVFHLIPLLHRHWVNYIIVLVPWQQSWRIWVIFACSFKFSIWYRCFTVIGSIISLS